MLFEDADLHKLTPTVQAVFLGVGGQVTRFLAAADAADEIDRLADGLGENFRHLAEGRFDNGAVGRIHVVDSGVRPRLVTL